jgi:hypothetical protein
MLKPDYAIPALPSPMDFETVPVLKALAKANRALAELKERAATIPNQGILIDTLALQEAHEDRIRRDRPRGLPPDGGEVSRYTGGEGLRRQAPLGPKQLLRQHGPCAPIP